MDLSCHKSVFESQIAMVGRTCSLSPLKVWVVSGRGYNRQVISSQTRRRARLVDDIASGTQSLRYSWVKHTVPFISHGTRRASHKKEHNIKKRHAHATLAPPWSTFHNSAWVFMINPFPPSLLVSNSSPPPLLQSTASQYCNRFSFDSAWTWAVWNEQCWSLIEMTSYVPSWLALTTFENS